MKLGEKVAFCFPSAGKKMQLFHLIFIQRGANLIEHPCKAKCYALNTESSEDMVMKVE